jgi:hypothetical protein
MREVVGFSMARDAASQVYEAAGIGPEDVDVVELHDCFAQNELVSYEALGLCPVGGAEKFVVDGDNTYGGKVVTNPSGGLLEQGPSARRHRPGAVHRAGPAAAWQRRQAPGRGRTAGAAAQPGSWAAPASSPSTNASEDESAMIDKKWIGHELPASVLPIERSRCSSSPRRSARPIPSTPTPRRRATPATGPAGAADVPVRAELDSGAAFRLIEDLQIPIAKLLHGEQSFSYHRPACVGDTVTGALDDQRHLRQEERGARVRRQDLARHQPARRARGRDALGARLPPLTGDRQ